MAEPRKPVITTSGLSPQLARTIEPVKQAIEMITGSRAGLKEIKGLPKGARMEDVVEKVNQIIARLNASGSANV